MIRVVLGIIGLVLILYFASGAWSAWARRPRCLSERDYRRAEAWRRQSLEQPGDADPVLVSLTLALLDGDEPDVGRDDGECLPSDDARE